MEPSSEPAAYKEWKSTLRNKPLIAESMVELVGHTPCVRLNKIAKGLNVIAKLESHNPASSVKDRLGRAMIEGAEARGTIKPGDLLVEPTSGNTGIGMALIAASKGYKLCLVMPESMSMERRAMLLAFGCELVLSPAAKGMGGAVAVAKKVAEDRKGIILGQFDNVDNVMVHQETTGPEIWEQTEGKIDILVSGVGTGGTVMGISKFLKSQKPSVEIIAVEPTESPVLSGGKPGPHKIMGIGAGFVPGNIDNSFLDKVQQVSGADAIAMGKRLVAEEGIMGGISAGAAAHVACELANKPENAGKCIVFILPSFGERYLSTALFSEHTEAAKLLPTTPVPE